MSDDVTWRDHRDRWLHRLDIARAWISFWRALSWRRRNGLWVTWTSLDTEEERAIFREHVVESWFDVWRAVRRRVTPKHPRIVRDPAVMRGSSTIEGTRILAVTIVHYLLSGYSEIEIHDDYPTLPQDSVEAVRRWVIAHDEAEWQPAWLRTLELRGLELQRDPGETDDEWSARRRLFYGE